MKLLFIKLLNHYEEHLEEIKTLSFEALLNGSYIINHHLQFGLCYCSVKVFKVDTLMKYLIDNDFLKEELEESDYLCKVPLDCTTKEEVINTFEFRINKLKELIEYENTK